MQVMGNLTSYRIVSDHHFDHKLSDKSSPHSRQICNPKTAEIKYTLETSSEEQQIEKVIWKDLSGKNESCL